MCGRAAAAAELAEARLAVEHEGKPPPRLSVVRRTPFPLPQTAAAGTGSQMRRPSMATKADEKRQAGEWWSGIQRPGACSGSAVV